MAETPRVNENTSGGEQALAPSAIHLLRTTTTVNLAHNQMADQKASMLMGAAFVVFTLTLAELGRGHMARPLVVLGAFAFVAAMLAVAVVMPAIRTGPAYEARPNPMFFGAIAGQPCDGYVETMLQQLASEEEIYRIMLCNVWQTSQVLAGKKYRLLSYAYRTFLAGLVLSGLLFLGELAGIAP